MNRQMISDLTAFDMGDKFANDNEVWEYFLSISDDPNLPEHLTAYDLVVMAKMVIENKWHYENEDDNESIL